MQSINAQPRAIPLAHTNQPTQRRPSLSTRCSIGSLQGTSTPLLKSRPSSPLRLARNTINTNRVAIIPHASNDDDTKKTYNTEFGYSRKDIILIGVGLIAFGYILYYGLQASGMDAGMAGNWVQLIIFLGICVGWVGSYLFRVATKQMTYVKQLEDYEDAVMRKRLEEMPESELESMMDQVEKEKEERRRQS